MHLWKGKIFIIIRLDSYKYYCFYLSYFMTAQELRQKYLNFFKSKGHATIPGSSLIPENDPTVLFTMAGMHPLVPYLMGEKHPEGNKLSSAQKCIRTGDIEEVGDKVHHTFFEMLGNWSLGDYFKEDAIKWSWEFLTGEEWLGLEKNKIAVSIFAGDHDAPKDEESKKIWQEIGVPEARIAELGKKDNWWEPAGKTGPCGPDTEMFYWTGADDAPEEFDPADSKWVEIWNDVFMEYNKKIDGTYEPLKQKNVDTGMGVERTLAVLNNLDDNYRTELFWPIIEKIEELSGLEYYEVKKAMRVVADHIKATAMIFGDDKRIAPSNIGQGYVARRLIRRAVRYGKMLGITDMFTFKLAKVIVDIYQDVYPEVSRNKSFIEEQLIKEEKKFRETLEQGEKIFQKMSMDKKISGKEAFTLFTTYGFPFELTRELAQEKGYIVDEKEFKAEMQKHSKLSKTASAGQFKGGLADASEETKKLHTAAHLLLEALKRVLGEHVRQRGSNITSERLRFDFSHPDKITEEQIKQVEDMVNEQIRADLPVAMRKMTVAEAKKLGATGVFESKYGEKVKVYSIGDYSKEICGGPHVEQTGELGKFKIQKEQSSSAGVRRIKAILK